MERKLKENITIPCSKLESYRKNPILNADILAESESGGGGNKKTMIKKWYDAAYSVHNNENPIVVTNNLMKELEEFTSDYCIRKKDPMIESFKNYCIEYKSRNFNQIQKGGLHIKWSLHNNVMLTGLTPIIIHSNDEYYIYYIKEKSVLNWQNELRHPLIQQYIANKINCSADKVHIGMYVINTHCFEFTQYNNTELQAAETEARELFIKVYDRYKTHLIKDKIELIKKRTQLIKNNEQFKRNIYRS